MKIWGREREEMGKREGKDGEKRGKINEYKKIYGTCNIFTYDF